MNIAQLIKDSTQQLSKTSDSAQLDAEILLCHVLKKDRSYLISWPENVLDSHLSEQFQKLVHQRIIGQPIAYLIKHKEFWSLDLSVSPETLIPRPETELLVEQVLSRYQDSPDLCLLDLGTGSGAIAIALASERPNWSITASDASLPALQVAKMNAQNNNIHNITFKSGHWFGAVDHQKFDIIASNPPYIAESDPHLKHGDVRFEPTTALVSGVDGLNDIRHIVQQSRLHLKPQGLLIIEHGYDQKERIHEIFHKNGFNSIMQSHDLSGHARNTLGIFQ